MPCSGIEPETHGFSIRCSTAELLRIILESGSHLFSRVVSNQVSSADCVLTVVFGMGTGVSHNRITTGNLSPAPSKLNICILSSKSPLVKPSVYYYQSAQHVAMLPPLTYLPRSLQGTLLLSFGKSYLEGGFTLRCLQRLSVPNLATQLCCWSATGAPEVRPSRSSRTKDSSSQISCAHNG